jgi:aspartate racemase
LKKLGLVGGTGPESTIFYYRALTEGVQQALGVGKLPPLVIESLSVFEVLELCARDDMDALTAYIGGAIDRLAAAGAEIGTLTALTPHIVFDRLRDASPIPLISAVEATRDEALAREVGSLALLGTKPTMTSDFFAQPLRDAGIDVVIPNPTEIEFIQDRIVRELEHGIVTDETRAGFVEIIERLRDEHGIEQVILGCTELPLLLDDTSSPVPCLDPVEVHSRALIEAVVND